MIVPMQKTVEEMTLDRLIMALEIFKCLKTDMYITKAKYAAPKDFPDQSVSRMQVKGSRKDQM